MAAKGEEAIGSMGEDSALLANVLLHEGTHFGQFLDGLMQQSLDSPPTATGTDIEFRSFWNQSFQWEQVREDFAPFDTPLEQSNETWYQDAIRGEANLRAAIDIVYGF